MSLSLLLFSPLQCPIIYGVFHCCHSCDPALGACSPLKAERGDLVLPNRRQTKRYIATIYNTVVVISKGNIGNPNYFCKGCVIGSHIFVIT